MGCYLRSSPGLWWLGCQNKDMDKAHNAPVSLTSMLAKFSGHWAPKKIAEINDHDVKIVKLQGEFTWHQLGGGDPACRSWTMLTSGYR